MDYAYNHDNKIHVWLRDKDTGEGITGLLYSDVEFWILSYDGESTLLSGDAWTEESWTEWRHGRYVVSLPNSLLSTTGGLGWMAVYGATSEDHGVINVDTMAPVPGGSEKTYTLKDTGGRPIIGATVEAAVVISTGVTNELGQAVFSVPNGAKLFISRSHPNYRFSGIDVEVA